MGDEYSEDLGTGTILASFLSAGKMPLFREGLNSVVKLGVMAVTVALSIFTEIPSGPVDLESSNSIIKSYISSSVHR